MAIMIFKATFQIDCTFVIKTITHDTNSYNNGNSFDLQSIIDTLIKELKNEGYERVYLTDITNISTPIIRKKY